jgi:hypothetical protein
MTESTIMAYTAPSVSASGTTFAQFQAGGASGHLELLIAAQGATLAPTVAPILSETGSGGSLTAATYYAVVTELNGFGETTASPASSGQAITGTQELVITPASLKPGNVSRNYYIGTSSSGPFTLVASNSTASSFTLLAPPSTNSYAVNPPIVNTTGLTYTEANGLVHNRRLELLRACKDGNFEDLYRFLRLSVHDFNHGNPMPFPAMLLRLRDAHVVFAMLAQLCSEMGTLIDANPGTLNYSMADVIGNAKVKRTWP